MYVTGSDTQSVPAALRAVRGSPVLTVTDGQRDLPRRASSTSCWQTAGSDSRSNLGAARRKRALRSARSFWASRFMFTAAHRRRPGMSRLWKVTPAIAATTAVVLLVAGLPAGPLHRPDQPGAEGQRGRGSGEDPGLHHHGRAGLQRPPGGARIPRCHSRQSRGGVGCHLRRRTARCSPASPAATAGRRRSHRRCVRPSSRTATSTC